MSKNTNSGSEIPASSDYVASENSAPLFVKDGSGYFHKNTGPNDPIGDLRLQLGKDGGYYLTPTIRVYNPEYCRNPEDAFDWSDNWILWHSEFDRNILRSSYKGAVGCFFPHAPTPICPSGEYLADENGTYAIGWEETSHPLIRFTEQTGATVSETDGDYRTEILEFPDKSVYIEYQKLEGVVWRSSLWSVSRSDSSDGWCFTNKKHTWCDGKIVHGR